jgi:hypothetical protein
MQILKSIPVCFSPIQEMLVVKRRFKQLRRSKSKKSSLFIFHLFLPFVILCLSSSLRLDYAEINLGKGASALSNAVAIAGILSLSLLWMQFQMLDANGKSNSNSNKKKGTSNLYCFEGNKLILKWSSNNESQMTSFIAWNCVCNFSKLCYCIEDI